MAAIMTLNASIDITTIVKNYMLSCDSTAVVVIITSTAVDTTIVRIMRINQPVVLMITCLTIMCCVSPDGSARVSRLRLLASDIR